jgi:putative copper export protein
MGARGALLAFLLLLLVSTRRILMHKLSQMFRYFSWLKSCNVCVLLLSHLRVFCLRAVLRNRLTVALEPNETQQKESQERRRRSILSGPEGV